MKKLGPTGFPFEKYIREIFTRNGFKVKINQYIPGLCCIYEIDFLARKDDLLYVGECKYRNLIQGMVHLETALANYARFLDIKNGKFFNKLSDKIKIKSLIVTNAKFTKEAIEYSDCVGVHLLGWKHPKGKGLEYLIDRQGLYHITILPSLKPYLSDILASKGILLVEDILRINIKKFIRITKIKERDLERLVGEAKTLLNK
jgi:hypothetical protein